MAYAVVNPWAVMIHLHDTSTCRGGGGGEREGGKESTAITAKLYMG